MAQPGSSPHAIIDEAARGPGEACPEPAVCLDGLLVAWEELDLRDVLAAAHRRELHRRGVDLPGRDEWLHAADRAEPGWGDDLTAADGPPGGVAEVPADASITGQGEVLAAAVVGGHVMTAPGPGLAGWLSCTRHSELDDAALLTAITGWRKLTSWAQAQELAAVAELARRRGFPLVPQECEQPAGLGGTPVPVQAAAAADVDLTGREHDCRATADGRAGQPDDLDSERASRLADSRRELEADFAPNEVALALTLTRTGAEYWMDLAVSLAGRLPRTLAALRAGRIDLNRARIIEHGTCQLSDDLARTAEGKVLTKAEHQTSGQLRAALQRAVISADPAAAERRRVESEKNARVELCGDDEGTASLGGRFLPAGQAAAAWARVCAMARAMESAGSAGGADLLRAQVFTGLLLGTLPLIPPPHADAGGGGDDDGGDPGHGGAEEPPPGPDGQGPGLGGQGPGRNGQGTRQRRQGQRQGAQGPGRARQGPGQAGTWLIPVDGSPPPWPAIPEPGHVPMPGCAPGWPGFGREPGQPGGSADDCAGPARPADRRTPVAAAGERVGRRPGRDGRAFLAVPWRTLAGLASEPGTLSRVGPITAEVTRTLAAAAADDADCEWRLILAGRSGKALAVTTVARTWLPQRRRSNGRKPEGQSGGSAESGADPPGTEAVPPEPGLFGRVILTLPIAAVDAAGDLDLAGCACPPGLRGALAAALRAGARLAGRVRAEGIPGYGSGDCQHRYGVPGYRVPDSMRALLEARDQTCRFPTCGQPAWRCDQDHTLPYHLGGRTCPCNLGPACRHHHRLKQLPRWQLTQPGPGTLCWRTPAGLTYTVTPEPHTA